jgi:hypothetical protein
MFSTASSYKSPITTLFDTGAHLVVQGVCIQSQRQARQGVDCAGEIGAGWAGEADSLIEADRLR